MLWYHHGMEMQGPVLQPRVSGGGKVTQNEEKIWRLEIPGGPRGKYRLAQLDDYSGSARQNFHWEAPFQIMLQARASASEIPGTWGFGLWNDPFSASLGLGGADRRLPALPQAAWFFFASPQNYLSFRDDLPAQGFLAATFRSARIPAALLAAGSPFLAGLILPPVSRLMRGAARKLVRQDAALVSVDPTAWHTYSLEWQESWVRLEVNGAAVLETGVAPGGRLGLVLWIDNQFAAWTPAGRVRMGSLENAESAWMEVKQLSFGST
jgi:hypothetical protein